MPTFHASMPALSPAALRSLELSCHALLTALGVATAWLFGPGGLLHAFAWLGCVPVAFLAAEVALRRWARRRALPFVPRRKWQEAWRDAARAAPVLSVLVRSLLFGLNVAQLAQGRPFWALDPNGWASVATGAVFWFCFGLMQRGSAAKA